MNLPIRSFLALAILAIVLAACGTTVGAPTPETPTPTAPAEPTADPTVAPTADPTVAPTPEPADPPAVFDERDVLGTITVYPGAASGPGGSIQDALDHGSDGDLPSLVNGVIFLNTDGRVYLATSVGDVTAPTFDGPILEVLEYPNEGAMWDMAEAELLGLEEANGIVFRQEAQVLGIVEVR